MKDFIGFAILLLGLVSLLSVIACIGFILIKAAEWAEDNDIIGNCLNKMFKGR